MLGPSALINGKGLLKAFQQPAEARACSRRFSFTETQKHFPFGMQKAEVIVSFAPK